ncbi:signal transduction histidine kinase [Streptomyces cavourensis]|uniref:Sensor histidine kinase n=1 Tax=Streptomyces cavourensis TaxID=67258 RepID=A0AAD0Q8K8_9ACTN|nr:sensor histidine kinase [Streptomyces cavourensis]AXI74080.1 sensor histidine kinase [Streptomyces cavourensis]TQO33008.1 signal transduction histidine kinase [Streptomyces cavourensis]GGU76000.1 histidine kinase [Streptomyces cavourensis]
MTSTPRSPYPAGATGPRTVEDRWEQFYRYGPYAVLTLAALVSAVAADLIMSRTEMYAAGVLLVAAYGLQLWWGRTRPRTAPAAPAGVAYYAVRTVLAFALTWLNPFFAIYAALGYFDVDPLLPKRAIRIGLLTTAVTLAGSQSGGLPPASLMNWVAFGALYLINSALALFFWYVGMREEEKARVQVETIAELERTNLRLEEAMAENAALHAQLLVQAREAGVDDERRRLAAEIHDTLAQGLTGIIAQLQVVTSTRDTDPGTARVHLDRAAALARHSLGEARRSVHNLAPAALEHDELTGALEKTVATWAEQHRVRADFTVTGTAEPVHDEVAATLLRIAGEALANAGRHAGASRVGVTLSFMDGELTLDVRDDGRGFDPAAPAPPSRTGGFGLGGMRARAERIAGTVEVESEPGSGTAVSARVPLVRQT